MKTVLPKLMLGTSSSLYPVYCQYLNSDGKYLRTCNDDVYIQVENAAPFVGNVNANVLNDTLAKIGEVDIKDEGKTVSLTAGNFNSSLVKESIDFPVIDFEEADYVDVTEEIFKNIKTALNFTSKTIPLLSYVVIDKDGIMATTKGRVFYSKQEFPVKHFVPINGFIFKLVEVNGRVGIVPNDFKDRCVNVIFQNGKAVFTVDIMDDYPAEKLKGIVSEIDSKKAVDVCNINMIKPELIKLMPIFHGEKEHKVSIENNGSTMIITASSNINGTSKIRVTTNTNTKFEMKIDMDKLTNIPNDYQIFYNVKFPDKLLAKNENNFIVVGGE